MAESFDIIIVGGGPGGYVAAIKAAQLGLKTACVEKRTTLGGTCLNVECIPSKALLQSSYQYHKIEEGLQDQGIQVGKVSLNLGAMMDHKDKIVGDLTKGIAFLFKKNGVTHLLGEGAFVAANRIAVNGQEYEAKHIIIATGSVPADLPGIEVDEKTIVSSTGALALEKVPGHMVVLGGGVIGLELGSVWQRLGSQVTVVEYMDRIIPGVDHEVGTALYKMLEKQGIQFKLATKVAAVEKSKSGLKITCQSVADPGQTEVIQADVLLSCAGRKPFTGGLGLEKIGVKLDDRGRVPVDAHYRTNIPGVYAVGDVIAGPMLAHKAEEEGIACVEMIAGQKGHVNYGVIPGVIYTHPEVASVGHTEEELKDKGVNYKVGRFPFSANARARANGDADGFVKILTDARSDEVLGIHILHAEAGTMIAQCALAMEFRASAEDIARTCHAHPTTSETIKEAAMAAYDKAIHI